MSVPAKHTDSQVGGSAFDYTHWDRCDQIMLMTYDEHTSGTSRSVASLPWSKSHQNARARSQNTR